MVLITECVAACIIFSLIIPSVKKNPLAWSYDYPPAIQKRLKALGLVENDKLILSRPVVVRKLLVSLAAAVLFALLMFFVNGADTFVKGFLYSYAVWLSVTWYDALVIDCVWFCHDKSIRIKGTEDMLSEYHNYGYHIAASCKGSLMGIPACALAGGITALLAMIIH